MRLTVSRCETDLGNIKAAYQSVYGTSLSNDVAVSLKLLKNNQHIEWSKCLIYYGRVILQGRLKQLYWL